MCQVFLAVDIHFELLPVTDDFLNNIFKNFHLAERGSEDIIYDSYICSTCICGIGGFFFYSHGLSLKLHL